MPAAVTPTHKDPTSVSIPKSLQSPERHFQLPLPSAGKTRRSSEAATGGPGLPGFVPHPPTLSSVLGSPALVLESGSPARAPFLSWLQLSTPRVLTTSEVPGRASASGLAQRSPLTLVFSPGATSRRGAPFSCVLGAPLLGTRPGLSKTLRQPGSAGPPICHAPPGLLHTHRAVWEKVSGR